jgi:hypothetical protein
VAYVSSTFLELLSYRYRGFKPLNYGGAGQTLTTGLNGLAIDYCDAQLAAPHASQICITDKG